MIDEIQPVGPSGLLNLIEAMKRGIPVGPAATGSDDNPSKQALADIQYPAAQGATPNLQAAPFGSLAPMGPQQPVQAAPAIASGAPAASIPLPRPRPAIPAASQALPPAVASAQASAPLARLQPINYAKLNNSGDALSMAMKMVQPQQHALQGRSFNDPIRNALQARSFNDPRQSIIQHALQDRAYHDPRN